MKVVPFLLLSLLLVVGCKPQGDSTTFYFIADPQFENNSNDWSTTRDNLNRFASILPSSQTVFVMGDLTQNGRADEMEQYMKSRNRDGDGSQTIANQFVEIYGNHDVDISNHATRVAWDWCVNSIRDDFNCIDSSTKAGQNGVYHYYLGYSKSKQRDKKLFEDNTVKLTDDTSSMFAVVVNDIIIASLGNAPHSGTATWDCNNSSNVSIDGTAGCTDGSLTEVKAMIDALYDEDISHMKKSIILLVHQSFNEGATSDRDALPHGYDKLLDFIEQYNVSLLIGGHTHNEQVINLTDKYGVKNPWNSTVMNINLKDIRGRSGGDARYYKFTFSSNFQHGVSINSYSALDNSFVKTINFRQHIGKIQTINQQNNRCIDASRPYRASTVYTSPCNTVNFYWQLSIDGKISQTNFPNSCLSVDSGANAATFVPNCKDRWTLSDNGKILHRDKKNSCLDIENTDLILKDCGSVDTTWQFIRTTHLISRKLNQDQETLCITGSNNINDALVVDTCSQNNSHQQWLIESIADKSKYALIKSALNPDLCISSKWGSLAYRTHKSIFLDTCGSDNSILKINHLGQPTNIIDSDNDLLRFPEYSVSNSKRDLFDSSQYIRIKLKNHDQCFGTKPYSTSLHHPMINRCYDEPDLWHYRLDGVIQLARKTLCLDASTHSNNAVVTIDSCSKTNISKWYLNSDNKMQLNGTNKCFNVPKNPSNNDLVRLYPCTSKFVESWELLPAL